MVTIDRSCCTNCVYSFENVTRLDKRIAVVKKLINRSNITCDFLYLLFKFTDITDCLCELCVHLTV